MLVCTCVVLNRTLLQVVPKLSLFVCRFVGNFQTEVDWNFLVLFADSMIFATNMEVTDFGFASLISLVKFPVFLE